MMYRPSSEGLLFKEVKMEWFFAFLILVVAAALIDDIHTKWHKREMVKAKHYKELIYT